MKTLKQEFEAKGYLVIKQAIPEKDIPLYIEALHTVGKSQKKKTWTIPDGMVQHKAFWPAIFNEKVLKTVREALGDDIRFMQHNDLHHGYSSFAWHRDGINRAYRPDFPDWKEKNEQYQIVRCGFYLQPESEGFGLGVVPGSHKLSGHLSKEEFLECDAYLSNFKNLKAKAGFKDVLKEKAQWVMTSPGDCIVFDPRLIHTGSDFQGKKYSFFAAYGRFNQHFRNHYTYYRHLRYDLNYKDFPLEFAEQLKAADLYAPEEKYVDKIDGAWVPSRTYSAVANLLNL